MRGALAFLTALLLCWLALARTDGFSLKQIENPQPFSDRRSDLLDEGPAASFEMGLLFSQPFKYLSKGRQSFVFASEDGKVVLKFFKQSYFRDPLYLKWARKVPLPWIQNWAAQETAKRNLRRDFYLNSYQIALSKAKRETGVLYFHSGGGGGSFPSVEIIDQASRKYRIDLNSIPFVLQKRGEPLYPALDAAFREEGISGVYRLLDQFTERIQDRIEQGIGDADCDIEHNWGVLDGQVLHLDPGRFYFADDLPELEAVKREWRRATGSFANWLRTHYPDAEVYLKRKIEASIAETNRRQDEPPVPISRILRRDASPPVRFPISFRI